MNSMHMMGTSQTRNRTRSQQWFERAQQSLVEGVNSPSRGSDSVYRRPDRVWNAAKGRTYGMRTAMNMSTS